MIKPFDPHHQIPDLQWNILSVDFIVELPFSSRHNAVMTVVDSVLKRVHFIPMHMTVTAEGAARLFLHQVWKLHGLLKYVISDRRPQFIAHFTRELYCLLGIVREPLTHDPGAPPVASQHDFIVQTLVTKEWRNQNARIL